MSFDPHKSDARRFRLVLLATFLAYGALAVVTLVMEAPPPKQLQPEEFRIAQLLIDPDEQARQKAEEEARRKAEEEARKKAEEEARKKAEEERKKAEEERKRREEEAKKRAEEERKKAEAERKRREEEAKKRAEEEARRKAEEEARKKAEEEARKRLDAEARKRAEEEAKRRAEEEARRKAEEEARKRAEAEARRIAEEQARIAAEEEARQAAEEAARLARIAAALEEKRRREEQARRDREAAMASGLMGGLDDEEELDDFLLEEDDAPLVSGGEGNLIGATPGSVGKPSGPASGGVGENMAEIDALLENLGDLEGMEALLGDDLAQDAASREEILAFLQDVEAGRVDVGEMVARATTLVESPFKILGERGGTNVRKADEISRIIRSHRVEIARFYETALKRIPGLSGDVTVLMTIGAAGRITTIRVESSSTGHNGFNEALLQRIRGWQFPPVSSGEVTGTYTFRFTQAR